MKVTALEHKHGGKITDVLAVGHETYRRVATWHYVCRVEWRDGGVTARANVAPYAICFDHEAGSPDGSVGGKEYGTIAKALNDYLDEFGEWLEEPKHMSDGRLVHWVAHKPDHEQPLEEALGAVASAA